MNKFAPIAFVLLLCCGVALWFLASDSLNFHIKSQLQSLGSKLSQQQVSVENVTIRSYQGNGTITNFIIENTPSTNPSRIENPTLSIASIDLVINRESLKKEVIIIDEMVIQGLIASYTLTETGTSLEHLLARVQENIKQLANSTINNISHEQQQAIIPPHLNILKVVIKSAVLRQVDDRNQQISTEKLPLIEWENTNPEAGLSGEDIGIEIFEQLLIELANHSNKHSKIQQSLK